MSRQILVARCATVAVSVVVALLIAELMVRIFSPQLIESPIGEYLNGLLSLAPNTHGRFYAPGLFDTTVTVGPQRFRGSRSYAHHPPPGVVRIATLGDSFTFGVGADDQQTYPAVLERVLRQRRWPTEVINAGVPGRGTGEEALYFDEYVREFHPNIVLLGVLANDTEDDAERALFVRSPDRGISPVPAAQRPAVSLWSNTRPLQRMPPVAWLYSHSELLWAAKNDIRAALTPRRSDHPRNSDLPLMKAEIEWLARRVAEADARLVVVYIPTSVSVYEDMGSGDDKRRRQEAEVSKAAAEGAQAADVPFLDLTRKLRDDYQSGHIKLYYEGLDEHPNPTGYEAIAAGVADFLLEKGMLASPPATAH